MKKWLSLICVIAMMLQAIPGLVMADGGDNGDQGAGSVIKIEGENYTSVSPENAQAASSYREAARGSSTELSHNDFLYLRQTNKGAIPESGYIANYSVTVPASGVYNLEIVASLLNQDWLSPYQMKVNSGDYFDVTGDNTQKLGQTDNVRFAKYKLIEPVTLSAGVNTISFRVLQGRKMDGQLHFFMDYFQVTQLSWGLSSISLGAPLAVFEEKDTKQAVIRFTISASQEHLLSYKVEDYGGNAVLQGNDIALENDQQEYAVDLTALERGHYTITAEADHNGKPVSEYLSIVMNSSERQTVANSPFAVDLAGGALFPASAAGEYARAVRLTGVDYVRERMHWSTTVSPASGAYDFSAYDGYNQAYADNGIRVLEMNHSAPGWAKDAGKNLPHDLLESYNLAKSSVQHFGAQSDWEFWNEPDIGYTADSESADQYAAFLKASTIAARDAGVTTQVTLAGIAYPPGSYMELLMQNDAAAYMDAYNYHAHRNDNENDKVPVLPPSFAAQSEFIQGYGIEGKPVYVTEAGISQKFTSSDQTLTAEQLRLQARYLAASTIQSLASGVDKHFWFVFPYYLENGVSWGSFSSRRTPYASVNAEAAMTHALGEAVYLGQLAGLPEGVKSYVFRDGTDSVAAYWSESDTPLTLAAGSGTALLTDIMGHERQLASADGRYELTSGPDVHYVRIAGSFPGLTTPVYAAPEQHAPELTAAERVVLTQKYPEASAAKAKAKGYLLDKAAVTDIQVNVYNFNGAPMSGVVTGSVYGGWSLAVPTQPVTVAPYSKATLTFALTGSGAVAADVKAPVTFRGVFNGEATSKSVTLIASNENLPVTPSLLVPDYDNPALWEKNISVGSTSTFTSPVAGEIQFDYSFGSGDKWTYPYFTLPAGTSLAGTEGVTFEVYFPAPIGGVVIRSFVYEQNGSGYFTPGNIAPAGGWQQIKIPWSDFAAFGTPDDNFHLDPEQIRKLCIGINSSASTNVSFKVRNIGVYTQPDTGLYSKIANLVPTHNQEVAAGTVAISADLVQGEIPVPLETVKVLVDGAAVGRQVNGQSVSASVHLTPGTHTVAVKGFDENGRLVSAKSVVTAIAGPPVTTAAVAPAQPDGQSGWYIQPVTVSLTAAPDGASSVTQTVYSLDGGGTWQTYTGPVLFDRDGTYIFDYRSTNQAGLTEQTMSISFKVDATAPTIAISAPTAASYSAGDDLTPQFTVTDSSSGVDGSRTVVTLDGQVLQQGAAVPLYTLPLGSHVLTVTAADLAGNTASQSVTFETLAVDATALNAAIAAAEQLQQDKYTAETWTVFAEALSAAKAKLAAGSTQLELDAARAGLHAAVAALQEIDAPVAATIEAVPAIVVLNSERSQLITATVYDQNHQAMSGLSIIWTSDNEGVASMNNGWVTGVSAGTTVVRATYGALSAAVGVTVAPSEATVITLTGDGQMDVGAEYTLIYGLANAHNVSAQDVIFTYDSQVFELIGATPLAASTVIADTYGGTPGLVRYKLATIGAGNELNGDAPVLSLTFKAKAISAGSTITVTSALLADGQGNGTAGVPAQKTVIVAGVIDRTALQAAVESAQQLYEAAVESYADGQYILGAKAALQAALTAAEGVLGNPAATQLQLGQAAAQLTQAMAAFESKRITPLTGDISGAGGLPDGQINIVDLGKAAYYYGATTASSNWTTARSADIDDNGIIDLYDLTFVARRIQ